MQERRIERALVPIENALEGGVDPVLDCLALEAPDVSLVGEIVQPVSYCLAAGGELALEDVTMVLSHPQALGQCKGWIAEHLPRAAVVPAASTAEAVRIVAEEPAGTRAAIGPRLAARHYRAVTLAEDCEDDPGNATRFGWLARTEEAPPAPEAGPAKTMLLFWGAGSGSPGLARLVPGRVRLCGREPHPDRVPPLAPEDGRIHVLPGPRRGPRRAPTWPARSQISISTPRWFESSAHSGARKPVRRDRYTPDSDG